MCRGAVACTCVGRDAGTVEVEARAAGRWLDADGRWSCVCAPAFGLALAACLEEGVMVRRTSGEVAHRYVADVERVCAMNECVSVAGWSSEKRKFLKRHAGGLGAWYSPRREVLKRATLHNVHDRLSMAECVASCGTRGVPLGELVGEYPQAYKDLAGLLSSPESGVFAIDSQIWSRGEVRARSRSSHQGLSSSRPKTSRGGTTAVAGVSKRPCTL